MCVLRMQGESHEKMLNLHCLTAHYFQDGKTKCKKKHCPKLSCSLQIRDQDQCCPRCAANREEEERAQRTLLISNREQRKRRLKRLRNLRKQERTSG